MATHTTTVRGSTRCGLCSALALTRPPGRDAGVERAQPRPDQNLSGGPVLAVAPPRALRTARRKGNARLSSAPGRRPRSRSRSRRLAPPRRRRRRKRRTASVGGRRPARGRSTAEPGMPAPGWGRRTRRWTKHAGAGGPNRRHAQAYLDARREGRTQQLDGSGGGNSSGSSCDTRLHTRINFVIP